ncbi:hypothetical protein J4760_08010 [Salinicoccus sp. ID82-1]|uniref:hypothetical protein n=1 Tax=Salinicoccus sp. ID82-1 TaxID=2820269 RepID=UPI001F1F6641|nr:hypothetical protein [Salinicoccus sp. ID82-1]MCG1009961.1 hypothetical protein [Salinicoccus sp. ID82-1]
MMNAQLKSKMERILQDPYVFQLVLDEDPEQDIYNEFDIEETKQPLGVFNHRLVTVISVKQMNDTFYVLFKHGGEIRGWTSVANSHYVYPKATESVKVDLETYTAHPFNRTVMGPMDMMTEFRGRLFASKSYVEIDGEKLEMLFIKGNLRGLVESKDLQKGRSMNDTCTVQSDARRFRDSNFAVELPVREEDFEAQIVLYFPDLKLVKLQHGSLVSWMDESDVDYDFSQLGADNPVIEEDAHQYYVDERQKTKAIIDGLLRRQIRLEQDADNAKARLQRIETLYKNLKQSKLGSLQVKLWERRKRRAK